MPCPFYIGGAQMAPWLSEVSAELWKWWTRENSAAKVLGTCSQSVDQMKRRCFYERQNSAVPTATSGVSARRLPNTGKADSTHFLEHSCPSTPLDPTTFSDYSSFCANYTPKIERMSLTLQRTQSKLALKSKYSQFLSEGRWLTGLLDDCATWINCRWPFYLQSPRWLNDSGYREILKLCAALEGTFS